MWVPDISIFAGPRYIALAKAINEAIDSGELPPGAQLPPQRELAQKLAVTVGTVGRAYKIVKARRLVTGEVGRGTFVRGAVAEGEAKRNFLPQLKPGTMDFALFASNSVGLSDEVFAAFTEAVSSTSYLPLNRYPPHGGLPSHRTAGATWIASSGYEPAPDSVLVFNGAQQAIMAAMIALADRETPELLCEQISYSGIKALASMLGHRMRGVEIDGNGIIPAALERALDESRARVLYVQPTVHNPTGAVMPVERRCQIVEIAKRRGITIIEDDTAISGLRDRPLPIVSMLPAQTVYITSLSKCVSPSLRIGYAACPDHIIDRIAHTLHAMTLANPPLMAEAATHMINSGAAARLSRLHFDRLADVHAMLRRKFAPKILRSHPAAFFAWISLPDHWTPREYCDMAERHGISVVPADNHTTSGLPPAAIRITLNPMLPIAQLENGIERIIALFSERAAPELTV